MIGKRMFTKSRSKETWQIPVATVSEPNKEDNMNNARCEDSRHLRKKEGTSEKQN
jgi:hypothetical protein